MPGANRNKKPSFEPRNAFACAGFTDDLCGCMSADRNSSADGSVTWHRPAELVAIHLIRASYCIVDDSSMLGARADGVLLGLKLVAGVSGSVKTIVSRLTSRGMKRKL